MSEPVVFISHFAIKEGALADLKRMSADGVPRIRDEKPGTVPCRSGSPFRHDPGARTMREP
jgi:hypothetical protein